jgi:hypothetical protein
MGWLVQVWYSGGFEVTGQGNMQARSSPSIHSLFIFNFTSLSFFLLMRSAFRYPFFLRISY